MAAANVVDLNRHREFKGFEKHLRNDVVIILPKMIIDPDTGMYFPYVYTVGATAGKPREKVFFCPPAGSCNEAQKASEALADGLKTIIDEHTSVDLALNHINDRLYLTVEGSGVYRLWQPSEEDKSNVDAHVENITGLSIRYKDGYDYTVFVYDKEMSKS